MLSSSMQKVTSQPPLHAPPLLPEIWLTVGAGIITLAVIITIGFMIWSRRQGNTRRVKVLNVVIISLLALLCAEQYLQKPDMFSRFQDRDTWLYIIVGIGIALVLVMDFVELFRTRNRSEMNRKQKIVSLGLAMLGFTGVLVVTWIPGLFPHVSLGHELGFNLAISLFVVGMTLFLALCLFWVRGRPERQKAARFLLVVVLVLPWAAILIQDPGIFNFLRR